MKKAKQSLLKSEKGMATLESIPLMLIFVLMLSYTLGGFGLVHTGILNSIAARNYAFEVFRNRSNVVYHRDSPHMFSAGNVQDLRHFRAVGCRVHTVVTEVPQNSNGSEIDFMATERPIRIGIGGLETIARNQPDVHLTQIRSNIVPGRAATIEVSPAWVITQYGMCLNPRCGD